jgi:hypothetical protein
MSHVRVRWFGVLVLVVGSVLALGAFTTRGTTVKAGDSTTKEICDNKVDDDDDKLIDCDDPDCKCEPPSGPACSPGYWKAPAHRAQFDATCVQVSGWTCEALFTALTCRGSDASCKRHEAASALNAISGCTE